MDDRTKGLLGYWLNAIGQTMSAVAATPALVKDAKMRTQLELWGNVLQSTGSALITDSEEGSFLEKTGAHLGSIGNAVSAMGVLAPASETVKAEIGKKGNLISTLGAGVLLPDAWEEGFTLESFLDVYGQFLSAIKIKGVDEELVDMIAEWSQAIASVLALQNAINSETEQPSYERG
ncbi:hypothetical protein JNUCC1_01559 [Lentibacillus sp. JNUCC-1]|uniref:DUF6944 family repetitive protein n=1 Tax=Lentibacillus sp. JNUCC-1 TaxID=2654513 RepID=UPI0012E7122F|nr:hypothetical protein [Lentibacillus sp. JNUCC-1]MUV37753.1 hypothetical protein [Lentibacillus sp. JNUCC-1]